MTTVLMYCTEICPYCVRAEQLLKRKGVTEIEKKLPLSATSAPYFLSAATTAFSQTLQLAPGV